MAYQDYIFIQINKGFNVHADIGWRQSSDKVYVGTSCKKGQKRKRERETMNEKLRRMMSDLPTHEIWNEICLNLWKKRTSTQVRSKELVIGQNMAVPVQGVDGEGPFRNNKERPLLVNGTVGNIQSICFPVILWHKAFMNGLVELTAGVSKDLEVWRMSVYQYI